LRLPLTSMQSANFQRDGRAVHDDNQGSRPNYPSSLEKLNLPKRPYNDANHTIWVSVSAEDKNPCR